VDPKNIPEIHLSSIIEVHFAARSNVINYYIPSFSHSSHGSIAILIKPELPGSIKAWVDIPTMERLRCWPSNNYVVG
jgi:hypothetical protein